jgi:glycosyltransferase involved in cell wall biosynthesis
MLKRKGKMETQTRLDYLTNVFQIDQTVLDKFHQHRVVVVIPAYNEERFIGSVILKIRQFQVTAIVVDDGSTDATCLIAKAAGAIVIKHERNKGKGEALNSGIAAARKLNPEAIVVIDGDGQHMVRELPRIVQPILEDKADVVVGSRYLNNTSNTPNHRKLGHWFFNKLTGITSQVNLTDSQSGYRAFSLRAINADRFLSTDFTVESEMQFWAHEQELRVIEVPVTIQYTDKPKRSVIQQGVMVFNGILHLIGQYRPLLFFGLPGFLIMFAGFTLGFEVVDIYRRVAQLAVGYAMISLLLAIIGMVLFSTGIILHSVRGLLTDMMRKNGHS